jgi:molybdate transport system regulatory protein
MDSKVGSALQRIGINCEIQLTTDVWICPKKINLLEAIHDSGSLSQAARDMRISYRHAWLLVDAMNNAFSVRVTRSKQGGSMTVTSFGKTLIRDYRRFESDVAKLASFRLRDVLNGIN